MNQNTTQTYATAGNFLFIAFSEEKFDSDNFLHLTQFFFFMSLYVY